MRIGFSGPSGCGKTTLACWLVSPRGPEPTRDLPLCPVGSRSIAKEMGFVGPDGEGRPYDVDRASLASWNHPRVAPGARVQAALAVWHPGMPTVRPLFQRRLAEAKIAWETGVEHPTWTVLSGHRNPLTPENNHERWEFFTDEAEASAAYAVRQAEGGVPTKRSYHASVDAEHRPQAGFVTDHTSLDDCAYAILHCPEVADKAFIRRAIAHARTYDAIFFCPLSAGQWLAEDPSRVADPGYHLRYEVILRGMLWELSPYILDMSDLDARKALVALLLRGKALDATLISGKAP